MRRRDEREHALREALRRQRVLRQDVSAPRARHEPRVRRLLVATRSRQRHVERGDPELAALVHRARAGAPDDERRGGQQVGQLGFDERGDDVACREGFGKGRTAREQPGVVTGDRVVPALVNDLRVLEQGGQRVADDAIDPVRALRAAGDVDDGNARVEPIAGEGVGA